MNTNIEFPLNRFFWWSVVLPSHLLGSGGVVNMQYNPTTGLLRWVMGPDAKMDAYFCTQNQELVRVVMEKDFPLVESVKKYKEFARAIMPTREQLETRLPELVTEALRQEWTSGSQHKGFHNGQNYKEGFMNTFAIAVAHDWLQCLRAGALASIAPVVEEMFMDIVVGDLEQLCDPNEHERDHWFTEGDDGFSCFDWGKADNWLKHVETVLIQHGFDDAAGRVKEARSDLLVE